MRHAIVVGDTVHSSNRLLIVILANNDQRALRPQPEMGFTLSGTGVLIA